MRKDDGWVWIAASYGDHRERGLALGMSARPIKMLVGT